jgi:hypothetical protein
MQLSHSEPQFSRRQEQRAMIVHEYGSTMNAFFEVHLHAAVSGGVTNGAGNRLDVHAYRCVGVAARNRKNNCVHRPHYVRLSPGAPNQNSIGASTFPRNCLCQRTQT